MAIDTMRLPVAGLLRDGRVRPPEWAMGHTPDARSDLNSLGPSFLGDDGHGEGVSVSSATVARWV
jgi:hypothetical protein